MKISAFAPFITVLAVFGTVGCHHRNTREFEYTLDADRAAGTVSVDCKASSSGQCHFLFSGDKSSSITIGVGDIVTVADLGSSASYCAASHAIHSDSCKWESVPDRRTHVSTRSTSDSGSGA